MLGSKAINEFASMVEGIGNENGAGKFGGDTRHAKRQFAELPFDFALYLSSERARSRDEETCRILCVFRLGQEIGGDPTRVAFCRQDNCFVGPAGKSIAQSLLMSCFAA